MLVSIFTPALLLLSAFEPAAAIKLDINDDNSIKRVASTIAHDMMTEYKGNETGQTPGLLPGPPPNPSILNAGYFWWEAGAMFGSLLDYWYYTGDDQYNDVIYEAMLHQVGDMRDYMPKNQTAGMGNDDQGFWGMTAMTAAEFGFRDPPPDEPQWLALAQAVFNSQAGRYDDETCGGGLRWQAYPHLNGYSYKNAISNGCFFNIASRLALYTGNQTYADWAEKTFAWEEDVGYISPEWRVYDGSDISNCTDYNYIQFSYNAGVHLLGAATMYNWTSGHTDAKIKAAAPKWKARTDGLLKRTLITFFPNKIGKEVACEDTQCTIDMLAYKAFLTRWMAATTKVYPETYDAVMDVMRPSAKAAAQQCSGGDNGHRCGFHWGNKDKWDGTQGVGQQMGALEVIQSLLIKEAKPVLTNATGGTSGGNPDAGMAPQDIYEDTWDIRTKDRAGAGIVTVIVALGFASMCAFMTFGK